MLEVRDLRGGYGGAEVLRGITLSIAAGEIVAVLGSNGAGKSTLNNTLCGFLPATAGEIRFDGRDITRARSTGIVAAGLIQIPEGRRVFPNLSVAENLELGCYRRGSGRRAANLDRVYALCPRLKERLAQRAGTLSGGEQQMLAIGRGMMGEPRLLILDEPSLGLSPILVDEMFALIGELNGEGLSILLIEQNAVQSLEAADRAYIIEHGVVALSGPAAELAGSPDLRARYLGL